MDFDQAASDYYGYDSIEDARESGEYSRSVYESLQADDEEDDDYAEDRSYHSSLDDGPF